MTDILLSLIIPTIICSIPFVGLFFVVNAKTIKYSASNTAIAIFGLTVSNLLTTTLATNLAIYGMTRNLPKDELHCVNGVGLFIMLGVLLAILTFVFGLVYTYRNYRLGKIYEQTKNQNNTDGQEK